MNKGLKEARFTDLHEPQKRPGRGYAYQALATALMAMAYNVRKLVTAIRNECAPKAVAARARRRRNDDVPLPAPVEKSRPQGPPA